MEHRDQKAIEQNRKKDLLQQAKAALGTPVKDRYWVEEVQPAYNSGGYYDMDVQEKVVDRSRYFSEREDAEAFMDESVPSDKNNFLRLRRETLYEKLERRWLRAPV